MVNRNAARHLLFAVSVLLCFFIYMGYRLRGPKAQAAPTLPAASTEFTSYSDGGTGAPTGLTPPALRPDDPAASLPSVISGDDDFSDWVPAARGDELALAPPSGGSAALQPPSLPIPSPDTSDGGMQQSGMITGLIPAPPQEFQPVASADADAFPTSLPALPIPGTSSSSTGMAETAPTESYAPPSYLPPPGVGAGMGLKPPSAGLDQHTYELETPDDAAPGGLMPPAGYSAMDSQPEAYSSPVDEPPARPVGALMPPPASTASAMSTAPIPPAASLVPPPQTSTRPLTPESAPYLPPATTRPIATPPPAPPMNAGMGTARPTTTPVQDDPAARQSPSESLRIYVVRPGDTLSSIASQELGSVSLADNIFLLNRDVIADPDHLLVGIKIRLPIREGAYGQGDAANGGAGIGRRPTYGLGRTHVVTRGDTLSSIAQRYYGSSSAWRFLYEANKNVVPNPNTLSVGVELSIPPYEN